MTLQCPSMIKSKACCFFLSCSRCLSYSYRGYLSSLKTLEFLLLILVCHLITLLFLLGVNCKILHEQYAEKTFLDLLSSEDGGVVESGCSGLRNMSSLQSSCQFIGSEGGLAVLVQCAQSEVGMVRTASAHTIATLINGAPANTK